MCGNMQYPRLRAVVRCGAVEPTNASGWELLPVARAGPSTLGGTHSLAPRALSERLSTGLAMAFSVTLVSMITRSSLAGLTALNSIAVSIVNLSSCSKRQPPAHPGCCARRPWLVACVEGPTVPARSEGLLHGQRISSFQGRQWVVCRPSNGVHS